MEGIMAKTNRVVFMKYFILQVQHDAVVLHPGADRARTLEASTFGSELVVPSGRATDPQSPSCSTRMLRGDRFSETSATSARRAFS